MTSFVDRQMKQTSFFTTNVNNYQCCKDSDITIKIFFPVDRQVITIRRNPILGINIAYIQAMKS